MSQVDDRVQLASSFVLQSPPGEINDVLNGANPFVFVLKILAQFLSLQMSVSLSTTMTA